MRLFRFGETFLANLVVEASHSQFENPSHQTPSDAINEAAKWLAPPISMRDPLNWDLDAGAYLGIAFLESRRKDDSRLAGIGHHTP